MLLRLFNTLIIIKAGDTAALSGDEGSWMEGGGEGGEGEELELLLYEQK